MFNSNGYVPYFAGMKPLDPSAEDDTRYISIKVTLGRDAFNELLIFLYTMVLGLFQDKMEGLTDAGIDTSGNTYFVNVAELALDEGNGISSDTGNWDDYNFGESSGNYLKNMFARIDQAKTTAERVAVIEPVVRSLPTAVVGWLIKDVVVKLAGLDLGGLANSILPGVYGNFSMLIASIFPLPFAHEGAPDPTANIYLDINPDKTDYGFAADNPNQMYSGIQAIELYINSTKVEAGTKVNTYRNPLIAENDNNFGKTYGGSSNYEANKVTINSFEDVLNAGAHGGANEGWDYLSLRIGPYYNATAGSPNSPMLGFLEAEKVEYIDLLGQTEAPERIVVTDIATREGTADGKPIILNETYLEDPAFFPQRAKVTWLAEGGRYDSVGSTEAGNKDYLGGTTIIWDASTVDLKAATLDSNGEYLAGYVYGYVLNKVMYAIPVYTTTAFALTNVYAYEQTGNNTFAQSSPITIDANEYSDKFNTTMPDLVRLKFQNMKTYTFGTVLEDASGNKLMAFAKDKATLGNDATTGAPILNGDGNNYKLEYAFKAAVQYIVANDEDVDSFNAGTLTFGLYTKIGDNYVAVPAASAVKGNTYYKVLTEKVDLVEYAVLDYSKLPTGNVGKNFPVGWIEWDNFTYNWAGGAVDVGFTYQWGFSSETEDSVTIRVKGYEVDPAKISSFATKPINSATDNDKVKNFTGFDAFGNLNTILADARYNNSLAEYIKTFTFVNGKYTSGQYSDLSVSWDLTNLEERLEQIKVENADGTVSYNYYEGIDVTVTAKVGANVFRYVTGYDATGAPIYGFVGNGETNVENGSVAQTVTVPIKVAGRVFESLETDSLVFDVYSSDVIDGEAFATNIKAMFAGNDKAVALDSTNLTITAPYVWNGTDYIFVDEGIAQSEFSYLGYSGENLYARLDIGTEKSGKQTVYVSINVSPMTANVYRLNVNREHTLDPEWYTLSDEYNILTVSFKEKGVANHTMKPDWSTVKYYANATYTKEVQNIFKGGTFYATVEAHPCDSNGNIIYGADGNALGSDNGQAQVLKIRLSVPKKNVTEVKFFGNNGDTDIFTSGAIDNSTLITDEMLSDVNNYTATSYAEYVKGEKVYNLSTYDYTLNPDNYFRVGEWGDYRNGTAVAITYTINGVEYTEIAFIREWDLSGLAVNVAGGTRKVAFTVGEQEFTLDLNTPSLAITSIALDGDTNVKFAGGITSLDTVDFVHNAPAFEYNVFKAWQLPTSATVTGEQVNGKIENVTIEWLDESAPGAIQDDFTMVDGKQVFRTDENGAYVIRTVRFYNQGNIVYPATGGFNVKIYLVGDNSESILDNAENVSTETTKPDGLNLTYYAFSQLVLPTTATVYYTDGTAPKEGVPVVWSAGAPTSREVANGSFTRIAYIGANLMSAEYTFTVVNNYEVEGFGKAGELSYTLTADKFYGGLPTSVVVYPNADDKTESYEATIKWYSKYDNKGQINNISEDGTVVAQISANGLDLNTRIALTIEATDIVSADGLGKADEEGRFAIDPLGKETTLFAAGEAHKVVATMGVDEEGNVITHAVDVVAEYSLPEDFFTNTVEYFGKTLTIDVTFTYPGGAQTMAVECLVLDRTIDKAVNPFYRAITVDPYLHDSFREGGLELPLEIEAYLTDGTVATFVPEWPSDSMITAEGFEDADYMVTFRAFAEAVDGTYVKYTFIENGITKTRYGTVEEADAVGGNYDDTRYKAGATQQVNVPLVVISREVASAEFVTPDYAKAIRTEARNTYTIKYTSNDTTLGNLVDVVYDSEDNMPTDVIYYNLFAFGSTPLPDELDVTFAKTGEVERYYIVFEGVEEFVKGMDASETTEADVVAHVYPDRSMAFELFSFDVTFTFKKVDVNRTNSTIASTTMSGDLTYNFLEVYSDEKSVYNDDNYADTVTFYPDGKFISLAEWNKNAEDGYRLVKYEGTDRYLYKVLGNGTVANGEADRTGTPTYFTYDSYSKTYNVTASAGSPDNTYVFVYTVSQELNADWDTTDVEINYRGGHKYVYATLTSPNSIAEFATHNSASTTVRVPVVVLDGTATAISADASDFFDEGCDSTKMAVTGNTLTFTFDPFLTTDVFERFETGNYKYFPAYATLTFANGSTVNVPVTWDFGIAKVDYAGGTYNITAIIDGSAYGVAEQEVRAKLVIVNRTAISVVEAENPDLVKNVGYYRHDGGAQTYINPYEYFSSTLVFPDYLTLNVNGKDGIEKLTYTTDGADGYKLGWSTGDLRPTYHGGVTYLTALLTGPDGSTQKFQIPFLVQKVMATELTTEYYMDEERLETPVVRNARYLNAPYTSSVTDGMASVYTIDAGDSASYEVPSGFKVTFSVQNPVIGSNGNVLGFVDSTNGGTGWDKHANGEKFSKVFAYVSVTMPADFELTAKLLADTSTITNLYANVQLGTGERIQIPITVNAKGDDNTPLQDGAVLRTRLNNGVGVAWSGVAITYAVDGVTEVARYSVTIASNRSTYTLSSIGGRKTVYFLVPYVGAVVDTTSALIDTATATGNVMASHDHDSDSSTPALQITVIKAGQVVPSGTAKDCIGVIVY
ncbi:MAG: Ig-like domain-containing protein [Clostridia bacterium]|nr:Ig-like domain-containing protein [Clostridia bacterium]